MKNQAIKILSKEHGTKVIKYFVSLGASNERGLLGSTVDSYYGTVNGQVKRFKELSCYPNIELITLPEEKPIPENWYIKWKNRENFEVINDWTKRMFPSDGGGYIYKSDKAHSNAGIYSNGNYFNREIYGDFTEITFEQFQKYVLNQGTMKQELKRKQILAAHKAFPCGRWQGVIADILKANPFATDETLIDVSEEIKILLEEGDSEQKAYVTKLGLNLIVDKNVFTKEFQHSMPSIEAVNKELFGGKPVLFIARGIAPRKELEGKCLAVNSDLKVTLHERLGYTVIEIQKK